MISWPNPASASFKKGTAKVDLHWVGGGTSNNFTFTYYNPGSSDPAKYIQIQRPNNHFTITGGSASGWSAVFDSSKITFTGGSISTGGNANFLVTASVASVDRVQDSWLVRGSNKTNGTKTKIANATTSGALDTGIDDSAPTNNSLISISANSSTQLTIIANAGSDSDSGLHSNPYQFDETTGGGSDSSWQSSTTHIDSGLTPNTSYTYRVKVRDALGNESGWSNTLSKRTFANVPSGGSFYDLTESGISVSWDSNSNPAGTEYYIENQTAGTNSGWQTDLSWASSGLDADTSYSFRVKARNGDSVETSWLNLGSELTEPDPGDGGGGDGGDGGGGDGDDGGDGDGEEVIVVPEPIGPGAVAPVVAARAEEAEIGAVGTTTSELSVLGGTWTKVPIKATPGDITPPRIKILNQPKEIIKGSQFSLTARALDDRGKIQGVIEYLAYSIDGGKTWHPVTVVKGMGEKIATFTIESFPLLDNNYGILLRARDNSENETIFGPIKIVIDQENPGLISLNAGVGAQEISSKAFGEIEVAAELEFKLIATLRGGPIKVSLKVDDQTFDFEPSDELRSFWVAMVSLNQAGSFTGEIIAEDGAGNKLKQGIFKFEVSKPLDIEMDQDDEVTIYEFNKKINSWQKFNGEAYQLDNPTSVSQVNLKGMLLPAGKYYFKVGSRISFLNINNQSNVINLDEISSLSGYLKDITSSSEFLVSEGESLEFSGSMMNKIVTNTGDSLGLLRGKDVIIFNFNPRNFASLEQLAIYDQIIKENSNHLQIIVIVPEIYRDQVTALAKRGNYQAHFFFDQQEEIQSSFFKYRNPASLFIDRRGEPSEIRSGFLTKNEVNLILEKI